MLKHQLCILFIFTFSLLCGQELNLDLQSSHRTYYYLISNDEAEKLYHCDLKCIEMSYFHSLVDSMELGKSKHIQELPEGHYLKVFFVKNELRIDLETSSEFKIFILNNKRDLQIRVQNKYGEILDDVVLRLNRRKIPFSEGDAAFVKQKSMKEGILRIEKDSFFTYYTLSKNRYYYGKRSKFQKFLNSPPVRYIYRPIRYVVLLPIDASRSLIGRRPIGVYYYTQFKLRNFGNRTKRLFQSKKRIDALYPGAGSFIIFDKEIYRKTDTLRFKAYLLNIKKNPIDIPVDVFIHVDNKEIFLETLSPTKQGVYISEFTLPDNVDIKHDKKYRFVLKSKHRIQLVEKWVKFEDYVLKKHNLELFFIPNEIYNGKNLEFNYRFTDANEFTAINSKVNLSLKWDKITHYIGDSVFIPFTSFLDTTFSIAHTGMGKIDLHLKDMPAVDGTINLKCRFTSPDNEVFEEMRDITYYHNSNYLEILDKTDSLKFQLLDRGLIKESNGQIYGQIGHGNTVLLYEGVLPHSLPIRGNYSRYILKSEGLSKVLDLNEIESGIMLKSKRVKNKLHLQLINPRKLPVNFQLFQGNKLIKRGLELTMSDTITVPFHRDYFSSIQFPWKGVSENLNFEHLHQKNQLFIDVTEPTTIYPGQEVDMMLSVTDYKGKPISGVDVTAYSMNGLFDHNPDRLRIGNFKHRYRTARPDNQISKIRKYHSKLALRNEAWRRQFGIDSILYYNVITPGDKVFHFSWPSDDSLSYIMPFVVDSLGRVLQTYILYIDYLPIYASWTHSKSPYIFKIDPGFHNIKIRTYEHEITLDSIFIEPGKKHIFSVNPDREAHNVKVNHLGNKLNRHEYNLLSKRMLLLKNTPDKSDLYLKDNMNIFQLPRNYGSYRQTPLVIGPINGNIEIYSSNRLLYSLNIRENQIMALDSPYIFVYPNKFVEYMPNFLQNVAMKINLKSKPFRPSLISSAKQDTVFKSLQQQHSDYFKSRITSMHNGDLMIRYNQSENLKEHKFHTWILLKSISIPGLIYVERNNSIAFKEIAPGQYELNVINVHLNKILRDTIEVHKEGSNFYRVHKQFSNDGKEVEEIKNKIDSIVMGSDFKILGQKVPVRSDNLGLSDFAFKVSGRLLDLQTNEPIPFAIMNNRTGYLGSTDVDGFFKLNIPRHDYTVNIEYVGYLTQQFVFTEPDFYTLYLNEGILLESLEIVSYKKQIIQNNAIEATTVGISIRGSRSDYTDYYIDGVRVKGHDSEIPFSIQESWNEFADTGFDYIDDESLHFEKKQWHHFMELSPEQRILRSDFRDHAFWKPDLITDKQGLVSFKAKFPEDITRWSTHYIAVNKGKQAGIKSSIIKSVKPMYSQLQSPQKLVFGDSVFIHGQAKNFTQDSITYQSTFRLEDSIIGRKQHTIMFQNSEYVEIQAKEDSLRISFEILTQDGFFDGENRKIEILPQGLTEIEGKTFYIDKDTTFNFEIDTSLGPIHVNIVKSSRDFVQTVADELIKYPHNCNEQLASRLTGLLIYKKYFNHLFDHEMDKEIERIMKKLFERFSGQGWSWYAGSHVSWVSHHVMNALSMANSMGYEVPLKWNESIENALLNRDLSIDYKSYIFHTLRLMEMGYGGSPKAFPNALKNIELNSNLLKIQHAYIQHLVDTTYVMDTVLSLGTKTYYGGLYFGESNVSSTLHPSIEYHNYYVTIETYHLLKSLGQKYKPQLDSIKLYFTQQYQKDSWLNTYFKSRIINIILEGSEIHELTPSEPSIILNGQPVVDNQIILQNPVDKKCTLQVLNSAFTFISYFQKFQNENPAIKQDYFQIDQIIKEDAELSIDLNYSVRISNHQDAGHIVVHIPISGSFAFKEKIQIPLVSHTEYNTDGVTLYIENLKKGTLEVNLKLIPLFKGNFSLNPVQINSMYFPQISGNTSMKKITIF